MLCNMDMAGMTGKNCCLYRVGKGKTNRLRWNIVDLCEQGNENGAIEKTERKKSLFCR